MAKQTGHDSTLSLAAALADSLNGFAFNIDGEQVDVTTLDSAKWEEIVASKKDLSITANGKYQASDDNSIISIVTEFIAGDQIAYVITYTLATSGQLHTIAGNALVSDWTISADDGSAVEWDCTLQNDGTPVFTNKAP